MNMISVIFKYRELLYELTMREIKQRYKQSVLGYAWVILNPLAQMLVMAFVFSMILRFTEVDVPYPLYLYAGLLPWSLFSKSLEGATNTLVENSRLITKIYFPREIFVMSAVLSKVVDFFLASTVFIGFMIFYQIPVGWQVFWFIPIFLIQLIFTYGLSLTLAAFNLFYRDIQYILSLVLIVWMYLTPVIYPTSLFPARYQFIFQINPMASLLVAYRQVILSGTAPDLGNLLLSLAISLVFLGLGLTIFKKLEKYFADIV